MKLKHLALLSLLVLVAIALFWRAAGVPYGGNTTSIRVGLAQGDNDWFAFQVPLNGDGQAICFADDGTAAIAGPNTLLVSTKAGDWKDISLGEVNVQFTIDGGLTYRNETGRHEIDFSLIRNALSCVVNTAERRVYLRSDAESARYLWSIPYDGSTGPTNLVIFTYTETPAFRFEIPIDEIAIGAGGVFIGATSDGPSNLLTTDDQGFSWKVSRQLDWSAKSIKFIDREMGFLLLVGGHILITEDGGKSWNPHSFIDYRGQDKLIAVSAAFSDRNTGFVVGTDGLIMKTMDAGKTWTRIDLSLKYNFFKVIANSKGQAWALEENGLVFQTLDRGNTWQVIDLNIKSASFTAGTIKKDSPFLIYESRVFTTVDDAEGFRFVEKANP